MNYTRCPYKYYPKIFIKWQKEIMYGSNFYGSDVKNGEKTDRGRKKYLLKGIQNKNSAVLHNFLLTNFSLLFALGLG